MSKKRLRNRNIKTRKNIRGGNPLLDAVKKVENTMDTAKSSMSSLQSTAQNTMDQVSNLQGAVSNQVSNLQGAVSNQVNDLQGNLGSAVSNQVNDLQGNLGSALNSQVNDLQGSLGSAVSNQVNDLQGSLGSAVNSQVSNLQGSLGSAVNSQVSNVQGNLGSAVQSTLGSAITRKTNFLMGAINTASAIKDAIMSPLTPEDKFNEALLKLRTNSNFKADFTNKINHLIVSKFYDVLLELGKYSIQYSDLKNEDITGENMFHDDDKYFYTELSTFASTPIPDTKMDLCTTTNKTVLTDAELNIDKIMDDTYIKKFFKDAMIISVPVIKNHFETLKKIIEKYKKLKNKLSSIIKKAKQEKNIKKYFVDIRNISIQASNLIGAILYEFNTKKKGGADKIVVKDKLDVKDDDGFNNSLLKMCMSSKKNLSMILKEKLYGLLNKIIKLLYDIEDTKNIINGKASNDNDFTEDEYKYLEKNKNENENIKFDINKYKESITSFREGDIVEANYQEKGSWIMGKISKDLGNNNYDINYDNGDKETEVPNDRIRPTTVESLKEKYKKYDDASAKNSIKNKYENYVKNKVSRRNRRSIRGGNFNIALPEKYREEASKLSDEISQNEKKIKTQEYNLDIFKYQEIIVKIIDYMFCVEIEDLSLFKNIVKPAFIEKQEQFSNLEKFWSKNLMAKQAVIKQLEAKIGTKIKGDAKYKSITDYISELEAQIKRAKTEIKNIDTYLNS